MNKNGRNGYVLKLGDGCLGGIIIVWFFLNIYLKFTIIKSFKKLKDKYKWRKILVANMTESIYQEHAQINKKNLTISINKLQMALIYNSQKEKCKQLTYKGLYVKLHLSKSRNLNKIFFCLSN